MSKSQFIGFPAVEEMVTPGGRVFLILITEMTSGQYFATRKTWLQVQQLDGEEVKYCRVPIGSEAVLADGKPYDEAISERVTRRGLSAEAVVKMKLESLGCEVIEAAVAMPTDVKMLNGRTMWIRYNSDTDTYEPAPVPAAAAAVEKESEAAA